MLKLFVRFFSGAKILKVLSLHAVAKGVKDMYLVAYCMFS